MKIITLTGPSCSGKTTLLNELVENHGYASIISHTTRPLRPGEIPGKDYWFIDQSEFDDMIGDGGFIEHVTFSGFSYGVSTSEAYKATKEGQIAVLIVEPQGLKQIKEWSSIHKVPLFTVYIDGSLETLFARYVRRLAGEHLLVPGVAERHGKRLASLIKEYEDWAPHIRLDGSGSYDMELESFESTNQEQVIHMIKELEF